MSWKKVGSKMLLKVYYCCEQKFLSFSVNIKGHQRRKDYYSSLGAYQDSEMGNPTSVRTHAGGKRGSATLFTSNNSDEDDDDDLFGLFR